jgi:hypothetical protein
MISAGGGPALGYPNIAGSCETPQSDVAWNGAGKARGPPMLAGADRRVRTMVRTEPRLPN